LLCLALIPKGLLLMVDVGGMYTLPIPEDIN
jgi:hypothetical protein